MTLEVVDVRAEERRQKGARGQRQLVRKRRFGYATLI